MESTIQKSSFKYAEKNLKKCGINRKRSKFIKIYWIIKKHSI